MEKLSHLKLVQRFNNENSLELKLGNFLAHHLPNQPYKVFSNIPFNITSAIVKKLVQADNPPEDTYLITQREAANKFIGKPEDKSNSLLSILIKSQFNITIFHRFNRNDFFPRPSVEVVMLQIQKRNKPLVSTQDRLLFFDFVTYAYSQFKPNILKELSAVMNENNIIGIARLEGFTVTSKPSQLELDNWIALFQSFKENLNERQKGKIVGAYRNLQEQQENLQKIHRTRVDKDWKKFS